jgi:hypothetical protein
MKARGMMLIAQDWEVSSARRIEASSASKISRIGVAKAREGVTIGRNGIVDGELSFKIMKNRGDRDSMSGDDPVERRR